MWSGGVVRAAAGAHHAHAVRGRVLGGGLQHGGPAGAGGPAQRHQSAGSAPSALGLGGDQLARLPALRSDRHSHSPAGAHQRWARGGVGVPWTFFACDRKTRRPTVGMTRRIGRGAPCRAAFMIPSSSS